MTSKPKPKKLQDASLVRTALVKLGVDRDELATCAPIGSILEEAEGGIPSVIAAMRFSDDPEIEKFFEKWDSLTKQDQRLVPIEAVCLLAEVNVNEFLGAAMVSLMNRNANIVKIIAVTNHPRTMRARVKAALRPGGYKDRNAIDQALRFLPVSSKSTTFIFPGGQVTQNESGMNPDDVDTDDLFPDLSVTQKMLTE